MPAVRGIVGRCAVVFVAVIRFDVADKQTRKKMTRSANR